MGFDAATVEAIANGAGLTRKTVYNLFASKEAVANAIVARAESQAEPLYRPDIEAGEPAVPLMERILLDSARWCMANPDLARHALSPRIRPTATPPAGPSFQGVVTDVVRLGQAQGAIRRDEDAGLLALIVLALYGQAMLSALDEGTVEPSAIRRILRIAVEGIGA